MWKEAFLELTRHLTEDSAESDSRPEFAALLAAAGLELWQAPEGFWAIRVKPAVMATQPTRPAKRRRLEGRA
jgi:hypothetical protein